MHNYVNGYYHSMVSNSNPNNTSAALLHGTILGKTFEDIMLSQSQVMDYII